MSNSDYLLGCKKRKRILPTTSNTVAAGEGGGKDQTSTAAVFKLRSFGENGYPAKLGHTFWDNIKNLVEFGRAERNALCNGLLSWSFRLEVHRHRPDPAVLLLVVEEPVDATSVYPHCRHCQYVGWGHHMISNMNYHFVVPSKELTAAMAIATSCLGCTTHRNHNHNQNQISSIGDQCNYNYNRSFNIAESTTTATTTTTTTTSSAAAAFGYYKSSSSSSSSSPMINLVELDDHALHGVIHCNGFGHLLCVNGTKTGASELTGHQIMEFWDRLCTGLRARKVSLCDISTKRNMELRLLHGVAHAGSWFTPWGYQFARGTYGVTHQMYVKAIQALQNIPLCLLLQHLSPSNHYIPLIFTRYQTLSDHSLISLGDLLHFMLELGTRLPKDSITDLRTKLPSDTSTTANCRWSPKRVEMAKRVIVETLKRSELKWVSRQEIRDAARAYIGDTGLLDFVLKSLGNHVVGNYLVRRSLNPVTKVLEYCLEDISGGSSGGGIMTMNGQLVARAGKGTPFTAISRLQLAKDLSYLYKCIFRERIPEGGSGGDRLMGVVPIATSIILDSKYFVKEFQQRLLQGEDLKKNGLVEVYCVVQDEESKEMKQPCERLVVEGNGLTIDKLKEEGERRFRTMYFGMEGLRIKSVWEVPKQNYNNNSGEVTMMEEVVGKYQLVFEGGSLEDGICTTTNNNNNNGKQGGWIWKYVDCACGAKEDDGERMVACDICEVWQHTRCLRIPNHEEIPKIFLCKRCDQEILLSSTSPLI